MGMIRRPDPAQHLGTSLWKNQEHGSRWWLRVSVAWAFSERCSCRQEGPANGAVPSARAQVLSRTPESDPGPVQSSLPAAQRGLLFLHPAFPRVSGAGVVKAQLCDRRGNPGLGKQSVLFKKNKLRPSVHTERAAVSAFAPYLMGDAFWFSLQANTVKNTLRFSNRCLESKL